MTTYLIALFCGGLVVAAYAGVLWLARRVRDGGIKWSANGNHKRDIYR